MFKTHHLWVDPGECDPGLEETRGLSRTRGEALNTVLRQPLVPEGRIADPDWIRIQSGQWIRIRNPDPDPGGQKWPTKGEFFYLSSCFELLDGLFWELKASSVTWTFFVEA